MDDLDEPVVTEHRVDADGSLVPPPTLPLDEWTARKKAGDLAEALAALRERHDAAPWSVLVTWREIAGRMEPAEVTVRANGEPAAPPARLFKSIQFGTLFEQDRRRAVVLVGALPGMTADDVLAINEPQLRLWAPDRKRRGRSIDVPFYERLSRDAMEQWRLGGRDWIRRLALQYGGQPVHEYEAHGPLRPDCTPANCDKRRIETGDEPLGPIKGGVTNYANVEKWVATARRLRLDMPPRRKGART